jgi:hypothetical protein
MVYGGGGSLQHCGLMVQGAGLRLRRQGLNAEVQPLVLLLVYQRPIHR